MVEDKEPTELPRVRPRRSSAWHVAPAEREPESWLLTYLDVMTLLLVMLVVLLAFADFDAGVGSPEAPSDEVLVETGSPEVFDRGAGLLKHPATRLVPEDLAMEREGFDGSMEALGKQLQQVLGDDIDVMVEGGTLSFRIGSELLFESARAELTVQGREVMTQLADVLQEMPYNIAVEGHTDNLPIRTNRFPSNWELSTGRATSVVRHLADQGVNTERLRATGYAHTRPVAANDTADGRAANRRVELVMELATPQG